MFTRSEIFNIYTNNFQEQLICDYIFLFIYLFQDFFIVCVENISLHNLSTAVLVCDLLTRRSGSQPAFHVLRSPQSAYALQAMPAEVSVNCGNQIISCSFETHFNHPMSLETFGCNMQSATNHRVFCSLQEVCTSNLDEFNPLVPNILFFQKKMSRMPSFVQIIARSNDTPLYGCPN